MRFGKILKQVWAFALTFHYLCIGKICTPYAHINKNNDGNAQI